MLDADFLDRNCPVGISVTHCRENQEVARKFRVYSHVVAGARVVLSIPAFGTQSSVTVVTDLNRANPAIMAQAFSKVCCICEMDITGIWH
jgi:hypothetical protein